jgi:hypothetical protein
MNETHLFSASGYLCSAAEDLRSIGLFTLADEVETLIAVLELELLIRIEAPPRLANGNNSTIIGLLKSGNH